MRATHILSKAARWNKKLSQTLFFDEEERALRTRITRFILDLEDGKSLQSFVSAADTRWLLRLSTRIASARLCEDAQRHDKLGWE